MDEGGAVLLELERLRGAVNEGFAHIGGRLDGMVQRATDTEKDVEKLDEKVDTKTRALDERLSAVEKKVWMAAGISGVLAIGCSGGIVVLAQSLGH